MRDEDIGIALEFRNLIVELEEIAQEVFRHDFTGSLKDRLIEIHEKLRRDLGSLIKHGHADAAKLEPVVAELGSGHRARRLYRELKASLRRAEEELERENYRGCMSEILVFLDTLRAIEAALARK